MQNISEKVTESLLDEVIMMIDDDDFVTFGQNILIDQTPSLWPRSTRPTSTAGLSEPDAERFFWSVHSFPAEIPQRWKKRKETTQNDSVGLGILSMVPVTAAR